MAIKRTPSADGLPPRFEPGMWVRFRSAKRSVRGLVTEYRGALGVGRHHLYRVEVPNPYTGVMVYEIPEEELKPVLSRSKPKPNSTSAVRLRRAQQ
jgi:hypothetical protein